MFSHDRTCAQSLNRCGTAANTAYILKATYQGAAPGAKSDAYERLVSVYDVMHLMITMHVALVICTRYC